MPIEGLKDAMSALLKDIHENMYNKALAFTNAHIKTVENLSQLKEAVDTGNFALGMWCGCRECEDKIKAETAATARVYAEGETAETCAVCGKKAEHMVIFARAY